MHEIVSDLEYIFTGLARLGAWKVVKKPFPYPVIIGLLSPSALVLISAEYSGLGEQFFLGLGLGGMERTIAYPVLP